MKIIICLAWLIIGIFLALFLAKTKIELWQITCERPLTGLTFFGFWITVLAEEIDLTNFWSN